MSVASDKLAFWETVWSQDATTSAAPLRHPLFEYVEAMVREYDLQDAPMLEVGCGQLSMKDLGPHYTATDISPSCAQFVAPARFVCCPATSLAFADNSFAFVFSVYVLEHVADIETALREIRRVAKPGAILFLKPAWFCRPWNGRPWHHKASKDCTLRERLLKATVTLRNSFPYRAADLLQWRLRGMCDGKRLRFRRLTANYDAPHIIDADAEVWLDPLDVIRWFVAHGDECLSHVNAFQRWWSTAAGVVIRVHKPE